MRTFRGCMPITNLEMTSIDVRRFTRPGEKLRNVQINHNSSVTQIVKSGKDDAEFDWRFTVNYSGVGTIKIEGKIIYKGSGDDIVETWNKENKMPDEVAGEIHKAIMSTCIPESVMLARDIRLPPPIPMPKINLPNQKKKKDKGGYGVEFA